jgi:dsRNA-specific ribonuclease
MVMGKKTYLGKRGLEFENFLKDLLKISYISPENIKKFKRAFTHKSVDPIDNYELYEFIGDVILYQFVVFYLIKKFPEILETGEKLNLKILHDYKQNYTKNIFFAKLATDLNFKPYVSVLNIRDKDTDVLADVFEAFIFVLYQMDDKLCYSFLKDIFDKLGIYGEDFYTENHTRLINLMTLNKLGKFYINQTDQGQFIIKNEDNKIIGSGSSVDDAYKNTIENFLKEGYTEYKKDKKNICNEDSLHFYAYIKNYEGIITCLEKNFNPNKKDGNGYTVFDVILLKTLNNQDLNMPVVKHLLEEFLKKQSQVNFDKKSLKAYLYYYNSNYFNDFVLNCTNPEFKFYKDFGKLKKQDYFYITKKS